MENGLGIHLLVNVSTCRCSWNICAFTSACLQSVSVVIKCGSLDDPTNGQVELSNTTVGSSANYTCTRGYILSNGNNTRTCEVDGEWSGDPPVCERKSWVFVHSQVDRCVPFISAVTDCGTLDDPDNGQVELSNTTFRSTANVTCSQGYSLSTGNTTRTCEANGQWSGDSPVCECM